VCARFESEETKVREIGGLTEALERYELSEGWIITLDVEESLAVGGRRIQIIPAWKWAFGKR